VIFEGASVVVRVKEIYKTPEMKLASLFKTRGHTEDCRRRPEVGEIVESERGDYDIHRWSLMTIGQKSSLDELYI
jgi:hypothetical protein